MWRVMAQSVKSPEEALEKKKKIESLKQQMKEVKEKIVEKDKQIKRKSKEIDMLSKEILDLAEKVKEEEHNQNNQDKKRLEELNEWKIEDLKKKLMAA